ncbi:ceramide glucosyltransferase-like isoform X2 [Xenia sp. Carnegie-2017]|uniref:ceramide glucosyltransferase-like isoform X2 n=1 Tax=Xenia sp. Carnegie-2017 TaxID=2897299 RepID=UPI001F036273|nr:ceramide glucosyltransferase-like isoform X2 [Xenia sp. Carnegie-2017]XP_046845607.1 ceramide glucosyltransferase-like isoform X2 [Xenia sp. Carnegie-2017]XP_046845673.1 ceramide glucosyltransferase-like isoform X2 [Xenia sp. Carnegie-2017]
MDTVPSMKALFHLAAFTAILGVLFMYFVHIVAIIYGKMKLHKYNHSSNSDTTNSSANSCPGVTMLKPLVGDDDNLKINLKSCLDINYTKLEILFCVQDEHDPAARTVEKLIDQHPDADVKLLTCGGGVGGVNPKINNMLQGYKVAKYDLLWINDSSLFVHPDTLKNMVLNMTADVGIAHQVPFLVNKSSFTGILQKVYFGTQHSRVYLFANAMGFTCTNGMSMLLRKHVIDDIGGLQEFSSYIAEDFFISKSFVDRGWKIALSCYPALQNPSRISFSSFFSRMVRWTRLRVTMMPVIGVLEPLTECLVIGLLGSCGAKYLLGFSAWKVLLGHCLLWFSADILLLNIMQGPDTLPPFRKIVFAWLLRETWTYIIFLRGMCGRKISWKKGAYRIKTGGKAFRIQGMKIEDDKHCL